MPRCCPSPIENHLAAGRIAGALDLAYVIGLYAIKFPAVGATRVLQGIAAGAIGRDAAAKGGMATAALGVAIHFAIALAVAAVFYALAGSCACCSRGPS